MSILSLIIQPLIRREIKKMIFKNLKDINPAIVLLMQIIEKFGTKFVVCLGAEAGIGYLGHAGKVEGWIAVVGMVLVACVYFFARRQQEKDTELVAEETGDPS